MSKISLCPQNEGIVVVPQIIHQSINPLWCPYPRQKTVLRIIAKFIFQ
jgi:hypothetical protein